ncbi:MAG: alpha/beta hydrolase [Pseudomonadota bacterium]
MVLLHGFPELAYSWRKIMPALAAAGYHVLAPDQRGSGRTSGSKISYDDELAPYRMLNLVGDIVALVRAFGLTSVHGIVGHDFGASVAAWCAVTRPDLFQSLALMSAPFGGVPAFPFNTAVDACPIPLADTMVNDLAALARPRKHYQWYYSTRSAASDMGQPSQGLHAFLRAYFHHKSADWHENCPQQLAGWRAEELVRMPTYYIMDLDETMPQTVAHEMPDSATIAANSWLSEDELTVYASEYARTGFQGSLNWYRCRTTGRFDGELRLFDHRTIDIPSYFIAGASDWGVHQSPGAFDRMRTDALTDMRGCHLIEGAGHWIQQEQAEMTTRLLLEYLNEV